MDNSNNYTNSWQKGGEIKFVELSNGVTMRYLKVGTGRPLVLIHSLRTQLDYFQRLIPLLMAKFTVYAVDLPGFGHSPIPSGVTFDEPFFRQSLVEFIKKLDLEDVVLVGESIGATLALTASPELTGRIAKIFALNPYDHGESFGGGIRRGKFGFIIGIFAILGRFTIELRFLLWLVLIGGVVDRRKLLSSLVTEFYKVGNRKGYRNFEYKVFKNWRSWLDAKSLYKKVDVPVVVIYGEQDWSKPTERDEHQKIYLPRARYYTLPNVGHFSALEAPIEIAKIIA